MTDKERLESLKRNREWTEATGEKFYTVDKKDYEWLIEQAERAKELEKQNKRYKQALEYIQREIRKAIYTPKKQKKLFLLHISWNSDFEREFESGKTRGLIQASDIVKEAIEILEGEE